MTRTGFLVGAAVAVLAGISCAGADAQPKVGTLPRVEKVAVNVPVTLTDNASPGTATIALSGTGQAASYEVDLSWNAPSGSSDPVVGYNIYRAVSGSSSYQLLNSTVNASMTYTDTTVVTGTAYQYYVESVDASGNQSAPSNTYSVTIP